MTNAQHFEFESPSLSYKNAKVTVDVLERDPTHKPRVVWSVDGREVYRTDLCKIFSDLKFGAARTAIYSYEDEGRAHAVGLNAGAIASPEHLAPVFLMWPGRRFNVNLIGTEVPLMDGSAAPFFYGLRRAAGEPEALVFYDAPVKAEWDLTAKASDGSERTFGHVRICPAETFEIEYVLDRSKSRGDVCDLQSAAAVSIYSPENLFQIFMARTFISAEEFEQAKAAGMLGGVDESCGMLLERCDGAKCSKDFRVASEPAMHKILDLIGDITFICPALPRVRIEITNGGHVSHRQIMERLIPYVSAGLFEKI
ncbi:MULTISPECIES: UDP-3-O-acyl-N-acetylglucosamine deacetylase [unclassified Fibrobacter]|uniref:UDP-3-O-acyl-N-acetylglucosamine deacetylase n=1 Tax=unclassified Fibrobacter TaxID=2634177 RepID=UPI000D6B0DBA|nr:MULTISPECIES: UDP-3-O-acyl-N-acetylglucosamine deacetylase [unclassified Fibrobacter]PWJ59811.1 UDP-3-O-[3-hydroxymyristoyl] N-acetylglucosamine deacetylase [Fibrobacter sp. UWR4]PZW63766.1 UDP-3-O-[3-hydroxymyristoyl] N-acetylglucosamine deacetylase [Fibrobacter sp. UWR1]